MGRRRPAPGGSPATTDQAGHHEAHLASPVVIAGGRVAGTWQAAGGGLDVALFAEAGPVPRDALETEAARIGEFLGPPLGLAIRRT